MVQESPKEHGARLAFCTTCGAAYLLSDERPYSVCHATDPVLTYDLESVFEALDVLAAHLNGSGGVARELGSEEPASAEVPAAVIEAVADSSGTGAASSPAPSEAETPANGDEANGSPEPGATAGVAEGSGEHLGESARRRRAAP